MITRLLGSLSQFLQSQGDVLPEERIVAAELARFDRTMAESGQMIEMTQDDPIPDFLQRDGLSRQSFQEVEQYRKARRVVLTAKLRNQPPPQWAVIVVEDAARRFHASLPQS